MHISHLKNIQITNISSAEEDIFFDCETHLEWPGAEDEIDQTSTTPLPAYEISFTEDMRRTLFRIFKLAVSSHANCFCSKMGIGIPQVVFETACAVYKVIVNQQHIDTVVGASLPLAFHYLATRSENLTNLARQIHLFLERNIFCSLPEIANIGLDNLISQNGYLFFGILALLSKYYCQGWDIPQPQRICLRIPMTLAHIFNVACQSWDWICATSNAGSQTCEDEYGRLRLSPAEKHQQTAGRLLAKQWVKEHHNNQYLSESAALNYYGMAFTQRNPSGKSPTNHTEHVGLSVQGKAAGPLSFKGENAIKSGYFLDLKKRILRSLNLCTSYIIELRLPEFSLLPMVKAGNISYRKSTNVLIPEQTNENKSMPLAGDIVINSYLRQVYPSINAILQLLLEKKIKAKYDVNIVVEKCWIHFFDAALPGQGSVINFSHPNKLISSFRLIDFILNNTFVKSMDIELYDKYAGLYYTDKLNTTFPHRPQLMLTPFEAINLLTAEDLCTPYHEALDRYWQENKRCHDIATIINILSHLRVESHELTTKIIECILHTLGVEKNHCQTKTYLFDINGYQATDMLVFAIADENKIILYMPRGTRHFHVFDSLDHLRKWVIHQCKSTIGKNEIALHFTLKDRIDGTMFFSIGRWGIDRWLANMKSYPDYIQILDTPIVAPLNMLLSHRQQMRSVSDAETLTASQLITFGKTVKNITESLYSSTLIPFDIPPLKKAINASSVKNTLRMRPLNQSLKDPVNRDLYIAIAILNEILPRNETGDVKICKALNYSSHEYFQIVQEDIALWKTVPEATGGEKRIINKLAVNPVGYTRTNHKRLPGIGDMHFTISLVMKNGQRKDNISAIRMFNSILPLRYNNFLKLYEIYNINHLKRPGYPVFMTNVKGITHWQFGRTTDAYFRALSDSEVAMAHYAFVTVRLFFLIMDNMDNLCSKGRELSPINSQGIAYDSKGSWYLKLGIHFISIQKDEDSKNYILGNKNLFYIPASYDEKSKKFELAPSRLLDTPNVEQFILPKESAFCLGTNSTLTYRDGFRGTTEKKYLSALGVDKIMLNSWVREIKYYGLSRQEIDLNPQYGLLAGKLKEAIVSCRHIIMDVLYASEREEKRFLADTVFSLLKAKNPDKELQENSFLAIYDILENMHSIIQQHIDDNLHRVWLVSFHRADAIMSTALADPLKRFWINVGYDDNDLASLAELMFCRYSCHELPLSQHTALLKRLDENHPGMEEIHFPQRYGDVNFPEVIHRLWEGKMTRDEVNFLISLPQANQIDNYSLMTDREVARRLFRKKFSARLALITRNADMFCQLLAHLHRALNAGHPISRHHQDQWLMALLFHTAFHAMAPELKFE